MYVEWRRVSSENFEAKAKCLLVQIFTKCELVQMFTKCVRVSSENFEAKCELVKISTQLNFYPCPTSWLPPYYCCLCPTKLQIMHVFFTKLCAHRSLKCGYVWDADAENTNARTLPHYCGHLCSCPPAKKVQKIAPTSQLRKHMRWKHDARKPALYNNVPGKSGNIKWEASD